MTPLELILYAEPLGEAAELCDRLWRRLDTTAQTYPPHVTLTGFFHRPESRLDAVIAAFDRLDLSTVGVADVELQLTPEWVGLAVTAEWMHDLIGRFVDDNAPIDTDDELRPKSWLHLSLAYGDRFDLETASAAAEPFGPVTTISAWRVALWHRHQSAWHCVRSGPRSVGARFRP